MFASIAPARKGYPGSSPQVKGLVAAGEGASTPRVKGLIAAGADIEKPRLSGASP
jgi:hypothetical protein